MLKRTSSGMALRLAGVLLVMMTALYLSSCCDSCPTLPGDPPPYKGWLYAPEYVNDYLYRIDTETDSLVDSVCHGQEHFMPCEVVASPDGRYLAVGYANHLTEDYLVRIYDAQTMEQITDINKTLEALFFMKNESKLVVCEGGIIAYYSVPGFAKIGEDSLIKTDDSTKLYILQMDEDQHVFYLLVKHKLADAPDLCDSTRLVAYNYQSRSISEEWLIDLRDENGDFYLTDIRIRMNMKKKRIYFFWRPATERYFNYAYGYDLDSKTLLFSLRLETGYGDLALQPDGRNLYVVDPGDFNDFLTAGTIYVLDAETGAYIQGISLFGYLPYPDQPLYADHLAITPDGGKLYVGSGRQEKWCGTICVVNTTTHRITKLIWPDYTHAFLPMTIGPKR